MTKVTRDDYTFFVDIERSKKLYSGIQQAFVSLAEYLPELTQFLAALGVDINKPIKYNSDTLDLLYTIFGTFNSQTGYELDFYGENKFVSVVVSDKANCNNKDYENIINLSVFGISQDMR